MYHEIAMLLSDAVIMRINTEGRKKFLSYNDIVNSSEIIAEAFKFWKNYYTTCFLLIHIW